MDAQLAMKIHAVMCDVPSLEKDMVVGKGTKSEYKAIGEKTVLNAVKPLFIKNKLIIFPSNVETTEVTETYTDSYGNSKLKSMTQSDYTFTLVDAETGESVDIKVTGSGADTQDKGSGKAATYALKIALTKTFMMFSGDDTDNDHSDNITKSYEKKVNINDDQVTVIMDLVKEVKADLSAMLKHYKVSRGGR